MSDTVQGYPLIVGISGYSVIQTLEYAKDAQEAGADFGLLLPAAYYGGATSKEVRGFFHIPMQQFGSSLLFLLDEISCPVTAITVRFTRGCLGTLRYCSDTHRSYPPIFQPVCGSLDDLYTPCADYLLGI